MDLDSSWLGILIAITIFVQSQAENYKRFEKIYRKADRVHSKYGTHFATDDNSFFFLDVIYGSTESLEDEANYTIRIDVPQDLWNSENITSYVCSSNMSATIKNPVYTKEMRENYRNVPGTRMRFSYFMLSAAERLNEDKVMIISEESFLNYYSGASSEISDINITVTIMDVKTCTPSYITFSANSNDLHSYDVNIVIYKDSFDIFTCGKTVCKTPTSKISYDFSGQQIGDIIDLKNQLNDYKLVFSTPILKSSIEDGFNTLVSTLDAEQVQVLAYLPRDGTEIRILDSNIPMMEYTLYSDTKEILTFCQEQNGTRNCLQYMGENIIMNSTVAIPIYNTTIADPDEDSSVDEYVEIYNSADGGFYLITKQHHHLYDDFKIMKINIHGDSKKTISISNKDSTSRYETWVNTVNYSENISDFCIYGAGLGKELVFRVVCIPKSEFDS